jgi:hypothetical protein
VHCYWVLVYQTTHSTTYLSSKDMLYVTTIVSKHYKKMEHSHKKHPYDHENNNVVPIHRSKYTSVIILGCLVTITLYLPLYFYSFFLCLFKTSDCYAHIVLVGP